MLLFLNKIFLEFFSSLWKNCVSPGCKWRMTRVVCRLGLFLFGLGVTAMMPLSAARRKGPPWAPFTYVISWRTSQYSAMFSLLFSSLKATTNRVTSVLNTAAITWLSAPPLRPPPKFVAYPPWPPVDPSSEAFNVLLAVARLWSDEAVDEEFWLRRDASQANWRRRR